MFSPDTDVDRFLAVLSEMGVTDAELRRLYGCPPGSDLEDAVREAVGANRTAALVRALDATGRSFGLDGRAADVDDSLTAALNRYGYSVEVSEDGTALDVVVFDAVANDVRRFRTPADPEPFREKLESTLLDPAGLTTVVLVDGSILVADRRAIDRLRAEHGDRIAPFEDPILRTESGVQGPGDAAEDATAPGRVERTGSIDDGFGAPAGPSASSVTSSALVDGDDAEGVEGSDDRALDDLSAALEDGGPHRHTGEGLDDIFAELEADRSHRDSTESNAEPDSGSLTGAEPTVTVADRGANEIVEGTTAEATFDELAARETEPDPDAILADAEDVLVEDP